MIADNELQVLADGQLTPVEGAAALPDGAHDPAISMDGTTTRVVLVGSGTLVRLPNDGSAPVVLYRGAALLPPSIDRFGWVWTAEANGSGLIAVSPDGEVMNVTGDVLAGTPVDSPVISLAVARDGSRIALVHVGSDQRPAIDVATILRDKTGTGRPQRLGSSFQVGFSMTDASQVEWMDDSTLAVLGLSGSLVAPTLHLVPVGGQTSALPLVDGTVSIAAGRGDRALYLVDDGRHAAVATGRGVDRRGRRRAGPGVPGLSRVVDGAAPATARREAGGVPGVRLLREVVGVVLPVSCAGCGCPDETWCPRCARELRRVARREAGRRAWTGSTAPRPCRCGPRAGTPARSVGPSRPGRTAGGRTSPV